MAFSLDALLTQQIDEMSELRNCYTLSHPKTR